MQIIINLDTNQATVVTTKNGVPVYPTKQLDIIGPVLDSFERSAIEKALDIIKNKAS